MDIVRGIGEIGFGVLFLAGGTFGLVYTLRHGEEFYGSFAANAWFGPAWTLTRTFVIPHAKLFTLLLVVFELSLAVIIFSRGSLVRPGLIAGSVFALAVVPASNTPGGLANLGIAASLALLAWAR